MRKQLATTVVFLVPTLPALAQCGDGEYGVGLYGTGGAASDEKAQGWHLERPSTLYPGETYTNVGNFDAGRIDVSNQGFIAATARDGGLIGHTVGLFGTHSGHY